MINKVKEGLYEAPLCEIVVFFTEGGILQNSGFGEPGQPGSTLVTDDPLPFGIPFFGDGIL